MIGVKKISMRPVKFAALCAYFGKWPETFPAWLESCRANDDIHFFIVSDIATEGLSLPENVRVVRMSFAELQTRAIQKLIPYLRDVSEEQMRLALSRVYKLCDYKPTYGIVFDDLFKGYEYWGFCDLDTIWGRISDFIPQRNTGAWKKIFPCGHLTFLANTVEMREVIFRARDFDDLKSPEYVYTHAEACYYDEWKGLDCVVRRLFGKDYYDSPAAIDDVAWWRLGFSGIQQPDAGCRFFDVWNGGRLWRVSRSGWTLLRKERAYIHFQKRKLRLQIDPGKECQWMILPEGIVRWQEVGFIRACWLMRTRAVQYVFIRFTRKIKKFCCYENSYLKIRE